MDLASQSTTHGKLGAVATARAILSRSSASASNDIGGSISEPNADTSESATVAVGPLELRDVITELAEDLYAFKDWAIGEYSDNEELNQRIWRKYPGF